MAIVETEIEGQRVYIDTETGQPAQAPVNTYGGRITYRPVQQEGLEGQVSTRYVVDTIDGYPASAYKVEPDGRGGLRTFNPKTGQYEQGASRVGMDFGDAGLPVLPPSIGSDFGGFFVSKNAGANNKGGFFEDYALPAIIGGIATAGVGSMLGAGSLFGGGANALTDAVGVGAYSPGGADALTNALSEGYTSGTAIGASGAGTQFAGAIPAAEAGAGAAGAEGIGMGEFMGGYGNPGTVASTMGGTAAAGGAATALGSAPGMTAAQYAGDIGSGAFPTGSAAAGMGGAAASGLPSWMNAIKPYTGLIGGALSAGGALLGASQISSAARDAADLSSGAAARSTALQERMFEQNQANQAPYLAAGRNALGRITTGMAPGGEFSKSFSMDDFTADPGYGFRMSEGLKAMDRNAAARGGLISGAALKAGTRYGQDMASQEYTNAFNRYQTNRANQLQPLQSLAGIGQTTVNNLANVGSNYASNVGNIDTNAANTRANAGLTSGAGYASAYGAVGNALNNAFNPNPVMAYLQSLKGIA